MSQNMGPDFAVASKPITLINSNERKKKKKKRGLFTTAVACYLPCGGYFQTHRGFVRF